MGLTCSSCAGKIALGYVGTMCAPAVQATRPWCTWARSPRAAMQKLQPSLSSWSHAAQLRTGALVQLPSASSSAVMCGRHSSHEVLCDTTVSVWPCIDVCTGAEVTPVYSVCRIGYAMISAAEKDGSIVPGKVRVPQLARTSWLVLESTVYTCWMEGCDDGGVPPVLRSLPDKPVPCVADHPGGAYQW